MGHLRRYWTPKKKEGQGTEVKEQEEEVEEQEAAVLTKCSVGVQ